MKSAQEKILDNTEILILVCARKNLEDKLIKKAEALISAGVDWEWFCHLALKSQAAVLIYNSLGKINYAKDVPQNILGRLKNGYLYALDIAARQHQAALNLLKLLSAKNIVVVPLKGTFLSLRLYADIESRWASVDIDIFVKWEDRNRLHEVLVENGYVFPPAGEIEQWLWQENCIGLESQNIDILYDIWLRGNYPEAVAGLWQGVRKVTEAKGLEYYEFAPEEMLLYLCQCLITSDNGYKRLKYICDINEFLNLQSRTLKWAELVAKAKKWRLFYSLYTALSLVGDLFNEHLGLSAANRLRPSLCKRALIKIFFNRKVMFRKNLRRRLMDKFLSYVFFDLIESRHAREYWLVIKRIFLPPKAILLNNKNYNLQPLYLAYVLRLFRGLVKLSKKLTCL